MGEENNLYHLRLGGPQRWMWYSSCVPPFLGSTCCSHWIQMFASHSPASLFFCCNAIKPQHVIRLNERFLLRFNSCSLLLTFIPTHLARANTIYSTTQLDALSCSIIWKMHFYKVFAWIRTTSASEKNSNPPFHSLLVPKSIHTYYTMHRPFYSVLVNNFIPYIVPIYLQWTLTYGVQ